MNDSLYEQAKSLSDKRLFSKATPLWEIIVHKLRQDSINSELFYTCLISLGECYSERNLHAIAISTFNEAIEIGKRNAFPDLFIPIAELAWLYKAEGEIEKSIKLYKESLGISNDEYSFNICFELAEIYKDINFYQTYNYLKKAFDDFMPDDFEKIYIITERIVLLLESNALLKDAIDYARKGVDLLQNSETLYSIESMLLLASTYNEANLLTDAMKLLNSVQKKIELFNENDDYWYNYMQLYLLKGDISVKNRGKNGELYYQKAIDIAFANEPENLGAIYYRIGDSYFGVHLYEIARQYFEQSLYNDKSFNHPVNIASQTRLAELHYLQGNYSKSIAIHETLLSYYRKENEWSSYSRTIINLAAALIQIGEIDEAYQLINTVTELIEGLSPIDRFYYYQNIGIIQSFWGNQEVSLPYLNRAYEIVKEYELEVVAPSIIQSIGEVYYISGHYEKAIEILNPLLLDDKYLSIISNKISMYNLLGAIYQELNDNKKALFYLQKAKILIENNNYTEVEKSTVYNNLGILLLDDKNFADAEFYLLEAFRIDSELKQLPYLGTDCHNLGLLYKDINDYKKAYKFFRKAVEIKEILWSQGNDTQKLSFIDQTYYSYELLIETLIRIGNENQALVTMEKYKNRNLLSKMNVDTLKVNVSFENIQKSLHTDTCLIILSGAKTNNLIGFGITSKTHKTVLISLENFFNNDYPGKASAVFTESKSSFTKSLQLVNQKIPYKFLQRAGKGTEYSSRLESLMNYYISRLSRDPRLWSKKKIKSDKDIGNFFYKVLFSHFEDLLQGKKNLIIIPNSFLEFLPFDTLVNNEDKYMANLYDIKLLPSISLLFDSHDKPVKRIDKILAMGISNYKKNFHNDTAHKLTNSNVNSTITIDFLRKLGFDNWPNLPYAINELNKINKTFNGQVDILQENELTPYTMKKRSISGDLMQYDILHFATHAIVLPVVENSFSLVLSNSETDNNPIFNSEQVENLKLNNTLTFLSACETSLGKQYNGDGTINLANSFLIAGSRFVIATLWPIHDKQTMIFVEEFYKNAKNDSISKALFLTKTKCILGELGIELKKAVYWSAFVCWGI